MGWSPVIGAPTLPESPITALLTGHYTHVPLLQGSNHDEGRFFVGLNFDVLQGHPMTRAQYPHVVTGQFGAANAEKILARYPLRHYRSPDLAYAAVFTDADFSCPALFADDFTQRSKVYAYEFSDPSPPNDFGTTSVSRWAPRTAPNCSTCSSGSRSWTRSRRSPGRSSGCPI